MGSGTLSLEKKTHFAACEHQHTYPHTMTTVSVVHSLESRRATCTLRLASCKNNNDILANLCSRAVSIEQFLVANPEDTFLSSGSFDFLV